MKAIVGSYTVSAHESWAQYADSYRGEVTIRRVGRGDEDKWGVFNGDGRLRRNALKWRKRNPTAPIAMLDDRLTAAPPERHEIREAFEYAPASSSATDAWKRNHTFTLAEAFFVCGAEAP